MVPGIEGSVTVHQPSGEQTTIFDAAMRYQKEGVPLVVVAGKEYGTGSSRDWAAKGTNLLGVRAVIAESYERIHRSNLVGMGVLPLQFPPGQSRETIGLSGEEVIGISALDRLAPKQRLIVEAVGPAGDRKRFEVICRIDTAVEVDYYRNGGILQTVIRSLTR